MGQLLSVEEESEPTVLIELRDAANSAAWEINVPTGTQTAAVVRKAANAQHVALQAVEWEFEDVYNPDTLLPSCCNINVDDESDTR